MTHWIDVVHWYMDVDAPLSAVTTGHNYNIKLWEAPDTVNTTIEFPKNFMAAYLGTYVSRVDDGGLEFRGEKGTLKVDRARLAFYRDDAVYAAGTLTPEPDIYVRSSGDGTVTHLQNWLDCIRSRKQPNAHIRVAHESARTSHIANAALKAGHAVKWNARAENWRPTDLRPRGGAKHEHIGDDDRIRLEQAAVDDPERRARHLRAAQRRHAAQKYDATNTNVADQPR